MEFGEEGRRAFMAGTVSFEEFERNAEAGVKALKAALKEGGYTWSMREMLERDRAGLGFANAIGKLRTDPGRSPGELEIIAGNLLDLAREPGPDVA